MAAGENLENRKVGMTKEATSPPKHEQAKMSELLIFDFLIISRVSGISNPDKYPTKKIRGCNKSAAVSA